MRYRQRFIVRPSIVIGRSYYRVDSDPWYTGTVYHASDQNAGAESRFEYSWDELHGRPPYRTGGPLNLWKYENTAWNFPSSVELISRKYGAMTYKYVGTFVPTWSPSEASFPMTYYKTAGSKANPFTPEGNHTWGDVSSRGATAWKKFRPGKPTADAGVFLGEIREVPRMLQTTARGFRDLWVSKFGRLPRSLETKRLADHWLNTQFGWRPFLSDLRNFYKTYRDTDKSIAQIRRDNGQWIRRGGSVFSDEDKSYVTGSSTSHCSYPSLVDPHYTDPSKKGSYSVVKTTTQRVWFEASFRYWIPNIDSVQWEKKAIAQLYGLNPNPALLWELTPWSWLVDWCSNVGDVFTNLDTGLAQNLAAKYAYVMGDTTCRFDVTSKPNWIGHTPTHVWSFWLNRKTRQQANPFGFSLTWDMLSTRQWSILGALGITRLH